MATENKKKCDVGYKLHSSHVREFCKLSGRQCDNKNCSCALNWPRAPSQHCVLCPIDVKMSPARSAKQLQQHYQSVHWAHRIPFEDQFAIVCQLGCVTPSHYHCPYCGTTVERMRSAKEHIVTCGASRLQKPSQAPAPARISQRPTVAKSSSKKRNLPPTTRGPRRTFVYRKRRAGWEMDLSDEEAEPIIKEECNSSTNKTVLSEEHMYAAPVDGKKSTDAEEEMAGDGPHGTGNSKLEVVGDLTEAVGPAGEPMSAILSASTHTEESASEETVMTKIPPRPPWPVKEEVTRIMYDENAEKQEDKLRKVKYVGLKKRLKPYHHLSMVHSLHDIEMKRCHKKCCKGLKYHCPLCLPHNCPPRTRGLLRRHLTMHWTYRVKHDGFNILKCCLGCMKPDEEGIFPIDSHWHCPLCARKISGSRRRMVHHIDAHNRGTAKSITDIPQEESNDAGWGDDAEDECDDDEVAMDTESSPSPPQQIQSAASPVQAPVRTLPSRQNETKISGTSSQEPSMSKASEVSNKKNVPAILRRPAKQTDMKSASKPFMKGRPKEVFQHVTAIVMPELLQLIPGAQQVFLKQLSQVTGTSCTVSPSSHCLIQGTWNKVSQVHQVLNEIVETDPLRVQDINHILNKLDNDSADKMPRNAAGEENEEQQQQTKISPHSKRRSTQSSKAAKLPVNQTHNTRINEHDDSPEHGSSEQMTVSGLQAENADGSATNSGNVQISADLSMSVDAQDLAGSVDASTKPTGASIAVNDNGIDVSDTDADKLEVRKTSPRIIRQVVHSSSASKKTKREIIVIPAPDADPQSGKCEGSTVIIVPPETPVAEENDDLDQSPEGAEQQSNLVETEQSTEECISAVLEYYDPSDGDDDIHEEIGPGDIEESHLMMDGSEISVISKPAMQDYRIADNKITLVQKSNDEVRGNQTVEEDKMNPEVVLVEAERGSNANLDDLVESVIKVIPASMGNTDMLALLSSACEYSAASESSQNSASTFMVTKQEHVAGTSLPDAQEGKQLRITTPSLTDSKEPVPSDPISLSNSNQTKKICLPSSLFLNSGLSATSAQPLGHAQSNVESSGQQLSSTKDNMKLNVSFSFEEENGQYQLKIALPNAATSGSDVSVKQEPMDVESACDGDDFSDNDDGQLDIKTEIKQEGKPTKYIACPVCNKLFKIHSAFVTHFFGSQCCSQKFNDNWPKDLQAQTMDVFTNVLKPECPLCHKQFADIKYAQVHYARKSCVSERKSTFFNPEDFQRDPKSGMFKCHVCDSKYESPYRAALHEARLHWPRTLPCPQCPRKYSIESLLKRHIETIHTLQRKPDKMTVCDHCGISIKQKWLKQHINRVHDANYVSKYKPLDYDVFCEHDGCKYHTRHPSELSRHRRRVHGEKDKKCSECDQMFALVSDLNKHMQNKHHFNLEERQGTCPHCSKKMLRKNIKAHIKFVHEDTKEHECEICHARFHTKHVLSCHMDTHKQPNERVCKYLCMTCGKGFRNKTTYTDHVNSHTGFRPYMCQECGKSFRHMSVLTRHMDIHRGVKYQCHICSNTFSSQKYLHEHEKRHTSGSRVYKCICGAVLPTYSALRSHRSSCSTWSTTKTGTKDDSNIENSEVNIAEVSTEIGSQQLLYTYSDNIFQMGDQPQDTLIVMEALDESAVGNAIVASAEDAEGLLQIITGAEENEQLLIRQPHHLDAEHQHQQQVIMGDVEAEAEVVNATHQQVLDVSQLQLHLQPPPTAATEPQGLDRYLCGYCQQLFETLDGVQEHMLQFHVQEIPQGDS